MTKHQTAEDSTTMNKADLDMLEKIFAAEISGSLYETSSKVAKHLETDEFIIRDEKILGRDRFGVTRVTGYRLTLKGNTAYCMSERCAGELA